MGDVLSGIEVPEGGGRGGAAGGRGERGRRRWVTIHSATPSPPESIKIGSCGESHFNASLITRGKVTRLVSIHHNFRREWRAESGKSTRPNRLMPVWLVWLNLLTPRCPEVPGESQERSRGSRRDLEISGDIPRFQERSRDLRRDPEIPGEVPRFQERSRDPRRDPEIPGEIPRFQERSRELKKDPEVPGEIPRFQERSRDLRRDPEVLGEIPLHYHHQHYFLH